MMRFTASILICFLLLPFTSLAEENVGQPQKRQTDNKVNKVGAACQPATSDIDLDVNNVRTRLLAGGDMWWDLNDAKYEIPKVEPGSGDVAVHSLFAGALWLGGIDRGGQLKVAAQTYRQSGNDFFPGPLDGNGSVDDAVCNVFDKHWKVTREAIDGFIALVDELGGAVPLAQIPQSILEWPGRGNPHAVGARNTPLNLNPSKNLAPFFDYDGDGLYNPENGDYPDVDGDQAVWWVYNDRGDIHSETGGEAIGVEIQLTAFGFGTNDEVNDMTFYKYNVQNFSTAILDSMYFGQWVDADLGFAFDDFVGVDADLALGICYNGDAEDGPAAAAYGENPPLVGVDFFQGPTKYTYDANDNIIDTTILGMSKFLYYDNDFSVRGNPEVFSHYYGYLSGTWKDGTPFTFGGNGYGGTQPTDYIFPDDPGVPGGWSECEVGNNPFDRRFMQSSGPFRLDPGASNEVVVGVVWVRPNSQSGCNADFDALRVADEKAQALFDNDFQLIDGPDAPDLKIRELDKEIVISISNNEAISNNYNESYTAVDPVIKSVIESLQDTNVTDSTYDFQGYIIYQLENAQVSSSEYRDLTKARPIAQVDIEDGVANIVNMGFDPTTEREDPRLMVTGNDDGILHSFQITDDAFASGNTRLVNNKTYYYSVVAYAYNNYLPYEAGNDLSQKEPYLEGRRNIKVYSAIPHMTEPEFGGTTLNAQYGDGPQITRIEGVGNGGNVLEFTTETESEIVANRSMANPVYESGQGPVNVRVYDPVMVPAADFELVILDSASSPKPILSGSDGYWVLRNLTSGEEYYSDKNIGIENEQLIPEIGLSITIGQKPSPGTYNGADNNGFLEATKVYDDPGNLWLSGVADGDGVSGTAAIFNWIRAGTNEDGDYADYTAPMLDEDEVYEDVIDGTFAPMPLLGGLRHNINDNPLAPLRLIAGLSARLKMDSVPSIDLVFTPNKDLWTRCVVLEMGDNTELSEGNVPKLGLRDHASLNKDGSYDQSVKGLSWFPGYAVNMETGRRLNIIFTEDSWLKADNGGDMMWNPTSNTIVPAGPNGSTIVLGGKHYIFVSNTTYDEGQTFHDFYNSGQPTDVNIRRVLERCTWATMSYLSAGSELETFENGLIPTETRVRLRVSKPYRQKSFSGTNNGYPTYQFSTSGLAPVTDNVEVASSALDEIRVVPNPYYAYSQYERSQLDNRVRITNLPPVCTVTIYSTDGTMIRRFQREAAANNTDGGELSKGNFNTSIDWDLTNTKSVPIASGMYIIHVEAPGVGEKTVKWFGVMRPIDLDTF